MIVKSSAPPTDNSARTSDGGRAGLRVETRANRSSGVNAPCVAADKLFRGHREILIEHAGAHYRLRITRANKLILTK